MYTSRAKRLQCKNISYDAIRSTLAHIRKIHTCRRVFKACLTRSCYFPNKERRAIKFKDAKIKIMNGILSKKIYKTTVCITLLSFAKQSFSPTFSSYRYTAIQLKSHTYSVKCITWMNPDVSRHYCWVWVVSYNTEYISVSLEYLQESRYIVATK